MNKQLAITMSLLVCAGAAQAADNKSPEQIAKDAGCLSCHSISEKVVGPAYSAIAEKYKGQKDAPAQLAQSIKNGSKGHWGRIPMPAHSSLSDAEIKTLVSWVLAQQPKDKK
ncbi:MAG: hypothetical protein RLZZ271_778 [Pseudomonadota bacterium]|jgi:cytochrome c